MKARTLFIVGSVSTFLSVALGAFAAHSLKSRIPAEMLVVFETGVRYQFYHSFALFVAGWALDKYAERQFRVAGWLFLAGIVLFSGSLYALAFVGVPWLGIVTPVGGLAFLAAWAVLAYGFWKTSASD